MKLYTIEIKFGCDIRKRLEMFATDFNPLTLLNKVRERYKDIYNLSIINVIDLNDYNIWDSDIEKHRDITVIKTEEIKC